MKEPGYLNLVEFKEIADFLRGPFGSSVKKSVCVNKGPETFKLYEQGNVINNDFQRGNYYITKEKFNDLKKFELQPGDIVFTCAGTLGKIAIAPNNIEKGIINSVLMRVRVDESKILRKYFFYFFKTPIIQNQIFSKCEGATIKNLFATKKLKSFKIPLPSFDIQKRIVSIIEKAEKLKQWKNESDMLTNDYLNSVFLKMFSGYLNKNNYENFNNLVDSTKLGLVKNSKEQDLNNAINYFRMDNINLDGTFNYDRILKINANEKEINDYSLKDGDFLFNTRNSKELVGKTCVFHGKEIFTFNNNILRIRFDLKKAVPDYINYVFHTNIIKKQLENKKKGTTSVFAIYYKDLSKIKVPVPPVDLQNKFTEIVKKVDHMKSYRTHSKKQIDDLFNVLMQKAFQGELIC